MPLTERQSHACDSARAVLAAADLSVADLAVAEGLLDPRHHLAVRGLISRKEAAAYLDISVRSLERLMAAGELHPILVGECVKFDPADLAAYVQHKKGA